MKELERNFSPINAQKTIGIRFGNLRVNAKEGGSNYKTNNDFNMTS